MIENAASLFWLIILLSLWVCAKRMEGGRLRWPGGIAGWRQRAAKP